MTSLSGRWASQEQDSSDVSETHITQLNDAYEFYGFAWEEKGPQSSVILDAVYTETEQEEPSRELSSTEVLDGDIRMALMVITYRRAECFIFYE
jgi:hypothetical protein